MIQTKKLRHFGRLCILNLALCANTDNGLFPVPRTIQPIDDGIDIGVEKVARFGDILLTGHVLDTEFITVSNKIEIQDEKKKYIISPEDRLTLNIATRKFIIDTRIFGDIFCDDQQEFRSKNLMEYTNKWKPLRNVHYPKICFIDSNKNGAIDRFFIYTGKIPKNGINTTVISEEKYTKHRLEREKNNLLVKIELVNSRDFANDIFLRLSISNDRYAFYDMSHFISFTDTSFRANIFIQNLPKKSFMYPFTTNYFLGSSITIDEILPENKGAKYRIEKNFTQQMFS